MPTDEDYSGLVQGNEQMGFVRGMWKNPVIRAGLAHVIPVVTNFSLLDSVESGKVKVDDLTYEQLGHLTDLADYSAAGGRQAEMNRAGRTGQFLENMLPFIGKHVVNTISDATRRPWEPSMQEAISKNTDPALLKIPLDLLSFTQNLGFRGAQYGLGAAEKFLPRILTNTYLGRVPLNAVKAGIEGLAATGEPDTALDFAAFGAMGSALRAGRKIPIVAYAARKLGIKSATDMEKLKEVWKNQPLTPQNALKRNQTLAKIAELREKGMNEGRAAYEQLKKMIAEAKTAKEAKVFEEQMTNWNAEEMAIRVEENKAYSKYLKDTLIPKKIKSRLGDYEVRIRGERLISDAKVGRELSQEMSLKAEEAAATGKYNSAVKKAGLVLKGRKLREVATNTNIRKLEELKGYVNILRHWLDKPPLE